MRTLNMREEGSKVGKELIFLGSITRAIRARDLLKTVGITAKIERQTNDIEKGCGYGIIVVDGDLAAAKAILNDHGFSVDEA